MIRRTGVSKQKRPIKNLHHRMTYNRKYRLKKVDTVRKLRVSIPCTWLKHKEK